MAEIEPGPDNDYQVQSTATFSRELWNIVMASIAARLKARELLEASFETLVSNGTQAALDMISLNVAPQLENLIEQINTLEEQLEDIISGGTAPNALQLGGQNPSFYLALGNATGTLPASKVTGIDALIAAATDALKDTAPAVLDTFREIAEALGNNPNLATDVMAALANRLRFDAAQSLTTEQKVQALGNLGFDPATYYKKTDVDGLLAQKAGLANPDFSTAINVGAGKVNTNGDVSGTAWGGWLSNYLATGFADKISKTASGLQTVAGAFRINGYSLQLFRAGVRNNVIETAGDGSLVVYNGDPPYNTIFQLSAAGNIWLPGLGWLDQKFGTKAEASSTINDLRFTARAWYDCPDGPYADRYAIGAVSVIGLTVDNGLVRGFWFQRLQAYRNNTWFEVGAL
ncbi:hypothetical protein ACXIUS_01455 [Bosea thiooxidans]